MSLFTTAVTQAGTADEQKYCTQFVSLSTQYFKTGVSLCLIASTEALYTFLQWTMEGC